MKRLYSLALALGTAVLASAQITGISIEADSVHDGSIPSLDGFTTYRIYAELSSELDFVSAVFGDDVNPLFLGCTGEIYQVSDFGDFDYANQINPLFFQNFPQLEFDSWLTIGATDANSGGNISSTSTTLASALGLFNDGQGFVINDPFGGSWFYGGYPCASASATDLVLDSLAYTPWDGVAMCDDYVVENDTDTTTCISSVYFDYTELEACALGGAVTGGEEPTNVAFGGDNNRVLLAQITATGEVYGMFNVQVFQGGLQSNTQLATGLTFSTNASDSFGCTTFGATNFDETATIDDLSCTFECGVTLQLDSLVTPTCNGDNDAKIFVSATGAQGADYYYRDTISGTGLNFGNFLQLVAGVYDIIVVDGAGCQDTLEVEVPVTEEVMLTVALSQGVSCHDGSDAVLGVSEITGGSGMYEYFLSSDPDGLSSQSEWTGLSGGQTLSVFAIDDNGCIGQSNLQPISNPTEINVGYQTSEAASIVDASCANVADGLLYLVGYGGASPSTLLFSVDGDNYGTSPLSVSGGTYTVTARDTLGCVGEMEAPVVVGPEAISINAVSTPETCFGGEDGMVSWDPTGGVGEFAVSFNGDSATESSAMDLAPGDYVILVADGNGCVDSTVVAVEAGVEITVSAIAIDATCNGDNDGEVDVTAEGGTGSFQFSDDGNNFSQSGNFDGLTAGEYTFFAQDEFGCVQSTTAEVGEPAAIEVTGFASEGSVTGEGFIDITITGGGQPPYSFEWIGPGVSGQDTPDLFNLSTGEYIVEVTDSLGCSTTATFNLVTAIRELGAGITASVYPNPSQGEFLVEIVGGFEGAIDFQVIDARGRILQTGQWISNAGAFRTELNLDGAEAGLYRLIMIANGRPSSVQLVKTN